MLEIFRIMMWLVFAHFIGDIALQSSWQADNKGKYWYVMLSHCMIWTACICIALRFVYCSPLSIYQFYSVPLWKVLFLLVGHVICDSWKSRQPKTPEHWWKVYLDQAFHFLQLLIVGLL